MTDRRKFLKQFAIGTSAIATTSFNDIDLNDDKEKSVPENQGQQFNMCGFAAPKMDIVRIGVVGLGMRGSEAVERLSYIDGVEIVALCDKYPDRVTNSQKTLE